MSGRMRKCVIAGICLISFIAISMYISVAKEIPRHSFKDMKRKREQEHETTSDFSINQNPGVTQTAPDLSVNHNRGVTQTASELNVNRKREATETASDFSINHNRGVKQTASEVSINRYRGVTETASDFSINHNRGVTQTASDLSINHNPGTGSCYLNFSSADIELVKKSFDEDLNEDNSIFAFYVSLKADYDSNDYQKFLSEKIKWNGLQEWIWLKRDFRYQVLNFPMDLDSLTFRLSKYGTRNLKISWTLSNDCTVNNKIVYANETVRIVHFLWSNIFGNSTDAEICHRTFDHNKDLLRTVWYLTTVWFGHDYDCYPIKYLIAGEIRDEIVSKFSFKIVLAIGATILGYMYPFLFHVLESVQLKNKTELRRYYKHNVDLEKPYGMVRMFRKFFFWPWVNSEFRRMFKYVPVLLYLFCVSIILCGMNMYKLQNELFEEDGYKNFPEVYKFGVWESEWFSKYNTYAVVVVVVITNTWIYIVYNESEDFVICIPGGLNGQWIIPIKQIMRSKTHNRDKEERLLKTSEILIRRFTMLFSIKFWRFIFKHSFSSCCTAVGAVINIMIWCVNLCINICFCILPGLWFFIFMFVKEIYPDLRNIYQCCIKRRCKSRRQGYEEIQGNTEVRDNGVTGQNEVGIDDDENNRQKKKINIFKLFLKCICLSAYFITIRYHIGFYIFIIRCFCYTIIYAIVGPEYILRMLIIVLSSLTYFVSYFQQFIDSYRIILKKMFEINDSFRYCSLYDDIKAVEYSDSIHEDLFNYVVDHFYSVKKRFFILILKTSLTVVFFAATLHILFESNRIDMIGKYLTNTVAYVMVLISPKVVSMFSQNKIEDEINKHTSEIENLIIDYYKEDHAPVRGHDDYTSMFVLAKTYCTERINNICARCEINIDPTTSTDLSEETHVKQI